MAAIASSNNDSRKVNMATRVLVLSAAEIPKTEKKKKREFSNPKKTEQDVKSRQAKKNSQHATVSVRLFANAHVMLRAFQRVDFALQLQSGVPHRAQMLDASHTVGDVRVGRQLRYAVGNVVHVQADDLVCGAERVVEADRVDAGDLGVLSDVTLRLHR
jgi:hypothetical protein